MTKILINPNSKDIKIKENTEENFFIILSQDYEEKLLFNFDFEKNTKLNFYIVSILGNCEKLELETNSNQKSTNSKSNFSIQTLLIDNAEMEYKGNIYIPKGAKKSEGILYHHTLLLSDNSKIKSIPCLEVIEDDVKACHGTSTGKIDESQIFYMQSRGLKRIQAINLLIKAFIKKDLKFLTETEKKDIEEKIDEIISEKIEKSCETDPCKCKSCKYT